MSIRIFLQIFLRKYSPGMFKIEQKSPLLDQIFIRYKAINAFYISDSNQFNLQLKSTKVQNHSNYTNRFSKLKSNLRSFKIMQMVGIIGGSGISIEHSNRFHSGLMISLCQMLML